MSLKEFAITAAFGLAVNVATMGYGYHRGIQAEHERRVAEVEGLNAMHDADLAAIDRTNRDALATAQQATRDAEARYRTDMAAIDAAHTKARNEQKAIADRTIDGLRAGTLRLRDQYAARTCPGDGGARGVLPSATGAPGLGNGPTSGGLVAADVLAILGATDEGDGYAEQLRACQAIVRADRGRP